MPSSPSSRPSAPPHEPGSRPRVIVTRKLAPAVEERMAELFDVKLNADDHAFTRDELAAAMATCDVLVPTVTDALDAELIAGAGEKLKLLANFGAGVDHIDLKAARARGIIITNTPGVFTDDTADMTMALILSVPRRLAEGEKLVRSGQWEGWSPSGMLGHRIGGKQLGIVGMGRIGQAVAHRARGFGLNVVYHNRRRLPESLEQMLGASFEPDLDTLIAGSDIITLHCPRSPETRGIIDARRIGLMKPSAYLINSARGELVDEAALIDALESGRIAGAGLDVYPREP
ncbi:2-hydroxyacid dehydrogenase, partial [Erythrobacter donghaensis]